MQNNLFMMILLLCQSSSVAKPRSDSGLSLSYSLHGRARVSRQATTTGTSHCRYAGVVSMSGSLVLRNSAACIAVLLSGNA